MIPTHAPDLGTGRVDRTGQGTYYVAADGQRFRVYDCVTAGGKSRRVPLESQRATSRIFVSADGSRRIYHRQRRELFRVEPQHLQRQLKSAEFPATEYYNPAERTAR